MYHYQAMYFTQKRRGNTQHCDHSHLSYHTSSLLTTVYLLYFVYFIVETKEKKSAKFFILVIGIPVGVLCVLIVILSCCILRRNRRANTGRSGAEKGVSHTNAAYIT